MKFIYELLNFNERYFPILLELSSMSKSKHLFQFCQIMIGSKSMSEYEIMKALFGKSDQVSFSKVKMEFRLLLIKVSCIHDIATLENNERIIGVVNLLRETLVSQIISHNINKKMSIEILEKSLTNSIKLQITETVLHQSRILSEYYGSSEYNKYKFKKYNKILSDYQDIYQAETLAIKYALNLQNIHLKSLASINPEIELLAQKYANEICKIKNVHTINFKMAKFRILYFLYEIKKDYQLIFNLCDTIKSDIINTELNSQGKTISIELRRSVALIQAGQYKKCIDNGLPIINTASKYPIGIYYLSLYIIKAYLYCGNIAGASSLISKLISRKEYKHQNQNIKEIIGINLGYIYLSSYINKSKFTTSTLPPFRLAKFLNSTPIFSKDKRGINVGILLLHVAFLLQRRKFSEVIDRIDALNRYASRYLRHDDTFRSNCMIKLVVQMAKADFHPIKTERYTAQLRAQLDQVPLTGSGGNIEVEIIPFETLWEIMLRAIR